jgi:hypothetical protein
VIQGVKRGGGGERKNCTCRESNTGYPASNEAFVDELSPSIHLTLLELLDRMCFVSVEWSIQEV